MSLSIQNLCDNILNSVRTSNLNYVCQETPYSIYLTIRKSWRKHQQVQQEELPKSAFKDEIDLKDEKNDLKNELDDLKAKLQASKHVEDDLSDKLDAAVVEVSRLNKEVEKLIKKNEEVKILKKAMQASKEDDEKIRCDLKKFKEIVSSKEKEIKRLEEQSQLEKTLYEKENKTNADDFKGQLAAKDVKINELSKEVFDLEEAKTSLLDLVYGCNDCGRHGDFCECNVDEEINNNVEPAASDFFTKDASLTQPDHCGLLQAPPSPKATETPVTLNLPHPASTLQTSAWTPPPNPPCSSCGGENYGPCPASVCFSCLPQIETTPPSNSTGRCSTTPPGTPPTLRWSQKSLHLHASSNNN